MTIGYRMPGETEWKTADSMKDVCFVYADHIAKECRAEMIGATAEEVAALQAKIDRAYAHAHA